MVHESVAAILMGLSAQQDDHPHLVFVPVYLPTRFRVRNAVSTKNGAKTRVGPSADATGVGFSEACVCQLPN